MTLALALTSDGKIDSNRFESIRQAESNQIDSHCGIVMKNFDSVPSLQRFSGVHHCAARSRHGLIRVSVATRFRKGN